MSIKVLGICGSMRGDSATAHAVHAALEGARNAGAEIDFIDIADAGLPFCDGRPDAETYPPSVIEFKQKIRDAAGIILGTPEYHNSMTGALKNAIDLCGFTEFEHKMVGVIGVAGGAMGAISSIGHLRTVMRGVGAWVVPHQVSISHSGRAFTPEKTVIDPALDARLKKLGSDVTKFARLIAAGIIEVDEISEG
jgi:NAD(P)H-dependent FMN reductase